MSEETLNLNAVDCLYRLKYEDAFRQHQAIQDLIAIGKDGLEVLPELVQMWRDKRVSMPSSQVVRLWVATGYDELLVQMHACGEDQTLGPPDWLMLLEHGRLEYEEKVHEYLWRNCKAGELWRVSMARALGLYGSAKSLRFVQTLLARHADNTASRIARLQSKVGDKELEDIEPEQFVEGINLSADMQFVDVLREAYRNLAAHSSGA